MSKNIPDQLDDDEFIKPFSEVDELYFETCGDTEYRFYDDGKVVINILESQIDTI